jgi:predicted transcriptional regulator
MAGLMLTFLANPAHVRAAASGTVQDRLGEKLGETRAAIVQSMQDNPKITVLELAKRLRLSMSAPMV